MATFTAIKNRGGGRGALGGVLRYVQQEEKTTWEDRRLVSGWNCTAQSVCSEMQLTKERFHKTDGRQYYHFVQSFAETDDLPPRRPTPLRWNWFSASSQTSRCWWLPILTPTICTATWW